MGTLEKHWDCVGFVFFFNILGEIKSTDKCGSSEWKIMSRLVRREKINAVITRQILQLQVYVTFMGQWGKSPAQLLKLSCLQAAIPDSPSVVQ